jgi:hypothetical protein
MIVGFLVPHRCDGIGLAPCAKCARPYCQDHLALGPAGLLCTACAEGRAQPVLLASAVGALGAADLAAFAGAEALDHGDDGAAFSDIS